MNEFGLNTVNIASVALCLIAFIFCLVFWFFLNRASVRANEQIVLLNELLEQQKKQTEILQRLGQGANPDNGVKAFPASEPIMFKDFIAER
ncbi:YebO family protein [Sodalis sp. RH21]|uniref:YebO family protein n=1 Tax=unclassified Sodalis (in: enterobacteria) TaxID=2636512 RepID=UPI0039B57170